MKTKTFIFELILKRMDLFVDGANVVHQLLSGVLELSVFLDGLVVGPPVGSVVFILCREAKPSWFCLIPLENRSQASYRERSTVIRRTFTELHQNVISCECSCLTGPLSSSGSC